MCHRPSRTGYRQGGRCKAAAGERCQDEGEKVSQGSAEPAVIRREGWRQQMGI